MITKFTYIYVLLSYLWPSLISRFGCISNNFLHSTQSCAFRSTLSALNPVHAVMLSIQPFCGLPLLLLPGTLACITVFSKLFCDLAACPAYVSFLLLILVRSSLVLPVS